MPRKPPVRKPRRHESHKRIPRQENYHVRNQLRGRRWRKYREQQLREEPYCRRCRKAGRDVAASEVDHIIPSRGNPDLHWDRGNLQSLCEACHLAKSRKESQTASRFDQDSTHEDETGT